MLPLLQTFAAGCDKPKFFGLVPWYQYLSLTPDYTGRCSVTSFNGQLLGVNSPFLLIALAILEDLIRVAGLVAVAYVIWGGIQYTTSQGSPDMTKKAQSTIINALIGVTVAIIAASVVTFIGSKLVTGTTVQGGGGLPTTAATNDTLSAALSLVFAVVASVSVLIIVINGFRYIVARGDPNSTAQARNGVLYAVAGLLITMTAYSIVRFVVGWIG